MGNPMHVGLPTFRGMLHAFSVRFPPLGGIARRSDRDTRLGVQASENNSMDIGRVGHRPLL
jgi:hypothetical protein